MLGFSQQPNPIDSLNRIINDPNNKDTVIAMAYLGLAEVHYLTVPDTAIFYCEQAESILSNTNFSFGKSETYSWLGYLHSNKGNYNDAMNYYWSSLEIKIELDDLEGMSTCYNNIGSIYRKKGMSDSTLYYFNKGLALRKKTGNLELIANSLNNIGSIYHDQNEIPIALKYYLASLRLKEKIGDKEALGTSRYNIGFVYNQQGDTAKALNYFLGALDIYREINNQSAIAFTLINIGNIYNKYSNYEKAIRYSKRSLEISKKIGSPYVEANALYNLGFNYRDNGNPEKAFKCINQALGILEQFGIKDESVSSSLTALGQISYDKGDYSSARDYSKRGLALAQEINAKEDIRDASELLFKIYEADDKNTDALAMYKLYIATRDSLADVKTQKKIMSQLIQYDFDKEVALKKIKHEKELALVEAEKNKQSLIKWVSIIGLGLVVIFALVLVSKLRITRKQKKIIEEKNDENKLLLGEIHHRVKNNLQVISSLLSLQEKSMTDESAKKAIIEGKERVKSMGIIHKMLYQNDNFSGIEMKDYILKLLEGLMDSFGMNLSNIKINTDFKTVRLDVDSAVPIGLIINELVINAFKYAYANIDDPEITVRLDNQKDGLLLTIKDNGNGTIEAINNSNSFGTKLVKSLVRQINGQLTLDEQNGLIYSILIKDYKLA